METKLFHLGDLLSIADGRLMSPRDMDCIYDILNFMTGDSLAIHQLPRAKAECRSYLLKQFPQLADIQFGPVTPENYKAVLEGLCAEYGEHLMVSKLPENAHEFVDPMSELAERSIPARSLPSECMGNNQLEGNAPCASQPAGRTRLKRLPSSAAGVQ